MGLTIIEDDNNPIIGPVLGQKRRRGMERTPADSPRRKSSPADTPERLGLRRRAEAHTQKRQSWQAQDLGRFASAIGTPPQAQTWGSALALKSLLLPAVFQEQLDTNASEDPARFWADAVLPAAEGSLDLALLLKFSKQVVEMPSDDNLDVVRRIFLFLTAGEMARAIFGPD
ncbi:MAG: hypothetical protein Q9170_007694 [Blastenia crenularia]